MSYRPDIDGLRALAVLLVLVFHAFPEWLSGGFIGVDVFFVISGYLITGLILDGQARGDFSLRDFYARRIRRIFPALALVMAATLIVGYRTLLPGHFMELGRHALAGALFVPNLALWTEAGYFDRLAETKPLLHLWSLGVEEQFYLVWPLLLVAILRFRAAMPVTLAILVASLALNLAIVYRHTEAAFFLPLPRFWELLAGAGLALGRDRWMGTKGGAVRNLLSVAGFAAIGAAAMLIGKTSLFPGAGAMLPVAGAAAIIAAGREALPNRLLATRPFVAIGLISYPLYLWHWPLLSFAWIINGGAVAHEARYALLAMSFVLATLTYLLVEKPIRFGKRGRIDVAVLAGAMTVVALAGAAAWSVDGLSRVPAPMRPILAYERYEYRTDARNPACWLRNGDDFSRYAPECHLRQPTQANSLVLVGDSHAGRFYPGLKAALGPDWDVAQLTRNACLPALGFYYPECQTGNEKVYEEIERTKPKVVVLFAIWSDYGAAWTEGSPISVSLERSIERLKAAGIGRVIVVGPFPKWRASLPSLLYQWWLVSGGEPVPDRLAWGLTPDTAIVDAAVGRIATASGATYVSLQKMLCNEAGCLTRVPGTATDLITWDYGHLTTPGATFVARRMIEKAGL